MILTTYSPEETFSLGQTLGECLGGGDIVLLEGDLGAGKSVLARGLARGVGVNCPMPSPTFTLMQPYEGRLPFYHFDLYRLDDSDQFYDVGLDEFVYGRGVAVIEWPERADLAPECCMIIQLRRTDAPDEREIEMNFIGLKPERQACFERAGAKWRGDAL